MVNFIPTDNGTEFNGLYKLKGFNKQLEIYYFDPGKLWQKGQVEWFNKKLRRFIKKEDVITHKTILKIKHCTDVINNSLNVLNSNYPIDLLQYT